MADSYIDNNSGSKKKYLIPLVVLMICAVSLTGAGYAYSANVANVDNIETVDGVTIAMFDKDNNELTGSLFTTDTIECATHNTNGHATLPDYSKYFDKDDKSYKTGGSSYTDAYAGYYYDEVYYNNVAVGYHAALTTVTKDTVTAACKTVGTFTVKVTNESTKAATISGVTTSAVTATDYMLGIYIVLNDGSTDYVIDLSKTTATSLGTVAAAVEGEAGTATYTATVYILLTDYMSALGTASVDTTVSYGFNFTAAYTAA